ncbi:MAG: dihydrodipicolinate synthase family protein [Opitutaceae bacterium]|nr:dihydrodipicolinate synthase family protein [Opitutaceae bacterium]
MHSSQLPQGIFSAQWIPTDGDGIVDRAALAAHLAFERQAGVAGVLALGSTGEFPFFSVEERTDVLALVAKLAGQLTLYANVSDVRPRAAIEVGRRAKALGYTAIALMPPMFFPVSQADVLAYFLHVADAVGLPVMLYNFPELTGKRIDLPTVAAFADRAPMIAIKQSGGEFAYHRDLIALGREKGFAVMSGSDTRLPEVFSLGAAGAIGGLVNIVPELMVEIHRCCTAGRPGDAALAAERMAEVGRVIDRLAFPPNVGAGLAARGFSPGAPKSILSPASRALAAGIEADLGALFDAWGLAPGPAAAA